MAVQNDEIVICRSFGWVSDPAANGGVMTSIAIPSDEMNNVWPDISVTERAEGVETWRKVFVHVRNQDSLGLIGAAAFVLGPTPAGDRTLIRLGTQTDFRSGLSPTRYYGSGDLHATVLAGDTSLSVDVEDAVDAVFQDGDLIAISTASGPREFLRLAASGAVSWSGNTATLTLTAGETVQSQYNSGASVTVASVLPLGDIKASIATAISSTSGTFDGVQAAPDGNGSVEQVFTLTFTSATAFDCVGDSLGALGSGNTGSDFAPQNPDFTRPYFTLPAAAWGGTWAAGDTLTVTTHPAAASIWERRIVPAGIDSVANNRVQLVVRGASE
jgi:hypothetical protein